MFHLDILLYKLKRICRWLYINFGWHLVRIWRNFPETTRDPKKKELRKKYFKEAMGHELNSLKYHQLFDWLTPKKKRYRRAGSRAYHQLFHPHSPTRALALKYVSTVGR